jgi:hypothetical protein
MRQQNEAAPLRVELDHGLPVYVEWRGQPLQVNSAQCIEFVQGQWWLDWEGRGISRRTYRVAVSDGRGRSFTADIVNQDSTWKLAKILD